MKEEVTLSRVKITETSLRGTVDAIRHSLELEEKWQEVTGPFGLKESMRYFPTQIGRASCRERV